MSRREMDLARSIQEVTEEIMLRSTEHVQRETGMKNLCLAGGVAANSALREALRTALGARGIHVSVPPLALCTDNAAMIAAAHEADLAKSA